MKLPPWFAQQLREKIEQRLVRLAIDGWRAERDLQPASVYAQEHGFSGAGMHVHAQDRVDARLARPLAFGGTTLRARIARLSRTRRLAIAPACV